MKRNLICGLLTAAMLTGTLSTAALAAEGQQGGLTAVIAPEPVIAPNPIIAPNPQTEMTRAMSVTRLWEMSGKPQVNYLLPFTDVTGDAEEVEAIRWAVAEGIVSGYTADCFGPQDPVSREQLSTMIYNYVEKFGMGFQGAWMFHLGCKDSGDIQQWAFEPVHWMVASRLLDGNAEWIRPQGYVTTEEADAIFKGLAQLGADKNVDFQAGFTEKSN